MPANKRERTRKKDEKTKIKKYLKFELCLLFFSRFFAFIRGQISYFIKMKTKFIYTILITTLCFLILSGCNSPSENKNTSNIENSPRIVTVGTAITETVFALDAGEKVVGVDNPSTEYIPEAKDKPKVGSLRALNAEGILSLKPTLVIVTSNVEPSNVLEQLRNAGINVLTLTPDYTVETVKDKVNKIAEAIGAEAKAKEINTEIDKQIAETNELLKNAKEKPKVMFVGRGPNMPNATMSGTGTTIDEMINLAGGTNPMNDFENFKEMTDEAVVAAQPEIILMTEKSFQRSGGIDGVLKFPGVALTPAGKNRRVIAVSDMYFQGFGPGVGKAVRELTLKFHPELEK